MKRPKNNYTVYIHVFPNGKYYVGQTMQDPERRWANGKGYRTQFVANAIRKYGWENIEHELVMSSLSREEADNLEEYLIALLKSDDERYGYNIQKGGGGTRTGLHNTPEQNDKIAKSHMKKVCCFSRNGEQIAVFESILSAAEFVNGSFRVISSCCNGTKKSGYGYVWRFENDPFDKYPTENKKGGVKGVPVVVHTVDGELVGVFKSAKMAAQTLNVNHSTVIEICKGRRSHCRGFVFDYATKDGGHQ